MTGKRRHQQHAYRRPRDRREVLVAVAGVVGVLVATALLLWVLAPDDSGSDESPVTVVTTPATEVVPDESTTTVPTSAVSTTAPGG
jgi:ferric-dicitrate binding protein FerR (iron transport regulator)